jgi:hypothetical protein
METTWKDSIQLNHLPDMPTFRIFGISQHRAASIKNEIGKYMLPYTLQQLDRNNVRPYNLSRTIEFCLNIMDLNPAEMLYAMLEIGILISDEENEFNIKKSL